MPPKEPTKSPRREKKEAKTEPKVSLFSFESKSIETNSSPRQLGGHTDWITCIALDPQGKRFATGSFDRTLCLWKTGEWTFERSLQGHTGLIYSIAFIAKGTQIASGATDSTIRIWNVESGKCERSYRTGDWIYSLAVDRDGEAIASGGLGNNFHIWNLKLPNAIETGRGEIKWINSIAFEEKREKLVVASDNKMVARWDIKDHKFDHFYQGHTDIVSCVAFNNADQMASGSWDNTVRIWDFKTGGLEKVLNHHSAPVRCIAFDASGNLLASGGNDNTIVIYNRSDKESKPTRLKGHKGTVRSIVFYGSDHLISGGHDKTIKIWNVASANCLTSIPEMRTPSHRRSLSSVTQETTKVHDAKKEDKELTELRLKLKGLYIQSAIVRLLLLPDAPPLPLLECYTPPGIVSREKQAKKEEEITRTDEKESKSKKNIRKSIIRKQSLLSTPNRDETISPLQFFKPNELGQLVKKIMLMGRAGIGKTTTLRFYLLKWAMNEIPTIDFDLIIFIPLHRLAHSDNPLNKKIYSSDKDIAKELIKYFLEEDLNVPSKKIEGLIKKIINTKILIMLDGFDEIIENENLKRNIIILHNTLKYYLLLTSRPSTAFEGKHDACYENIGFSDHEIEQYVHKFFVLSDRGKDLEKSIAAYFMMLRKNRGVSHIPRHLEVMCSAMDAINLAIERNSSTLANFYSQMFDALCRRYLEKRAQDRIPQYKAMQLKPTEEIHSRQVLQILGKLAIKNLTNLTGSQLLGCEEVGNILDENKEEDRWWDIQEMGFIKGIKEIKDEKAVKKFHRDGNQYYFIELAIEEFAAANYLFNCLISKNKAQEEIIRKQKYSPRWIMVLTFLASLLDQDRSHIQPRTKFWEIISDSIDWLGIKHLYLLIHCLEEWHEDKQEDKHETKGISRSNLIEQVGESLIGLCMKRKLDSLVIEALRMSPSLLQEIKLFDSLLEMLGSGDEDKKTAAAIAVAKFESSIVPSSIIESLIKNLIDDEQYVREHVAMALGQLNPTVMSLDQLAPILQKLVNDDRNIRLSAIVALNEMSRIIALPEVYQILFEVSINDPDDEMSSSAILLLSKMGSAVLSKDIIAKIEKILAEEDENRKIKLLELLHAFGTSIKNTSIPEKLKLLYSTGDLPSKEVIARIFGNLDTSKKEELIELVIKDINNEKKSEKQKTESISHLGLICTNSSKPHTKAVIVLTKLLEEKSPDVRSMALHTVTKPNFADTSSHKLIYERLKKDIVKDSNQKLQIAAIEAFGKMVTKDIEDEVIAILTTMLNQQSLAIQRTVIQTLAEISSQVETKSQERIVGIFLEAAKSKEILWPAIAMGFRKLGGLLKSVKASEIQRCLLNMINKDGCPIKEAAADALLAQEDLPVNLEVAQSVINLVVEVDSLGLLNKLVLTTNVLQQLTKEQIETIASKSALVATLPEEILKAYFESGNEQWLAILPKNMSERDETIMLVENTGLVIQRGDFYYQLPISGEQYQKYLIPLRQAFITHAKNCGISASIYANEEEKYKPTEFKQLLKVIETNRSPVTSPVPATKEEKIEIKVGLASEYKLAARY